MATFTERLGYLITANGREAIREFRSVREGASKDLGGTEGILGRLQTNAKGVLAGFKGFGAGIVAGIGADLALQAFNDLVDAASNLEQSVGAVESVFGSFSEKITDFGENAAEAAGLSKREVNELAAKSGSVLQGLGLSAEDAAEQVINLEKRGADLAATFGGPTSEAVHAMTRALVGERDPIENYGVSLRDSDVKARILALGLDTTTLAARKQATAIATLDLIYEKTSNSAGQFNREQDTAAGSQARANAAYENARAELGENLLPVQTAVTEAFGTLAGSAEHAGTAVQVAFGPALSVMGAVRDLLPDWAGGNDDVERSTSDNADSQEDLADSLRNVEQALADGTVSAEDYRAELDRITDTAFGIANAEDEVTLALLRLEERSERTSRTRRQNAEREAEAAERGARRIRDAEESVADARDDLNKINTQDGREAARRRLRDAEQRLAEVREDVADDLADAASRVREEIDEWAPSLDRATEVGIENRDVFEDIVERANDVAGEMKEQGHSQQEINEYLATTRERMTTIADQAGFSRDSIREFLDLLKEAEALVPSVVSRPAPTFDPQRPGQTAGDAARWAGQVMRGDVTVNFNAPVTTIDPDALAEQVAFRLRTFW